MTEGEKLMDRDAQRITDEALRIFKRKWEEHASGYPGGTLAFMATYVDKSLDDAARNMNLTARARLLANLKFAKEAQAFLSDAGSRPKSITPPERPRPELSPSNFSAGSSSATGRITAIVLLLALIAIGIYWLWIK